jgi:hypothetical protein
MATAAVKTERCRRTVHFLRARTPAPHVAAGKRFIDSGFGSWMQRQRYD